MIKYNKTLELYLKILLIVLLLFGGYLSFVGGYGSDEDTLPMIGVFQAILSSGELMQSRFTGYPVSEFGIGFLSHFFGSFSANLVTFSLLIISIFYIYRTFETNDKKNKLLLFFILCLSNPVIFFDNLEPIDYAWALAPFSIGCYMFKNKRIELALLFFTISIGARINYGLFITFFILFFNSENNLSLKNKIYFIFCCLFFGSLFYLPTWFQNSFGLEWLSTSRPVDQGLFGLISRFIYKLIHTLTFLSFFFIIYIFLKEKILKKIIENQSRGPVMIIFSNLILFLWIPAELSYLQLGLILFYFLLLKFVRNLIIIILILTNFSAWIFNVDFLKIKYKTNNEISVVDNNKCHEKKAIGANFQFSIKEGSIKKYFLTREMIECWINPNSERGKKIIEGRALK